MLKRSDDIVIRPALKSDLKAVIEIESACFDATERFSPRVLAYLILQSRGGTYVAVSHEQVVGYISLLQRSGCCPMRIYSVAVLPNQSGKGIGSRMMAFAIEEARKRDLSKVTLEVHTQNASAMALYEKYGFVKHHVLRDYYAMGEDAFYMIKTLK